MAFSRFEDLIAWQKAQDLAEIVYVEFGNTKDFSFRDQICRAAVSVSNNIAEGFGRSTDADFKRFLYIALGSCHEVKSMVYLAKRLNFGSSIKHQDILEICSETSKVINGLIKSFKE